MVPVILFIMIGVRLGYTDFWYWFCVAIYGITMLINIIKKVTE